MLLTNTNTGIYKITSPSGKIYIGQSLNIRNRYSHYKCLSNAVKKQRKFYASLLKHGFENHKFEILHELPKDADKDILNIYEILYMEAYTDCGIELLNIKNGGLSGRHSEETKEKIRNSEKGKKVSLATKEKMSFASRRPRPYRKGFKMSETTKLNMSEAAKKRTANRKGHKHSKESIEKMKISQNKRRNKILC